MLFGTFWNLFSNIFHPELVRSVSTEPVNIGDTCLCITHLTLTKGGKETAVQRSYVI